MIKLKRNVIWDINRTNKVKRIITKKIKPEKKL